jgi:hypothetical protein
VLREHRSLLEEGVTLLAAIYFQKPEVSQRPGLRKDAS